MPRISEFFGIVIYMYWFDQQKHKSPHFHARFAGDEAVFDLDGRCLEGDIGAWAAASAGKEIPWVAPLR